MVQTFTAVAHITFSIDPFIIIMGVHYIHVWGLADYLLLLMIGDAWMRHLRSPLDEPWETMLSTIKARFPSANLSIFVNGWAISFFLFDDGQDVLCIWTINPMPISFIDNLRRYIH